MKFPNSRSGRIVVLASLAALAGAATPVPTADHRGALPAAGQTADRPITAPINPDHISPPTDRFGYKPHPVDLSHIGSPAAILRAFALPAKFDWRALGGVTPVKNQGGCGSCWAFAALGGFESLVLIRNGRMDDFSEESIKECNYWARGCGGGNAFVAANHLTTFGTVDEICDPYHDRDTGICRSACPRLKQATGWKLLSKDTTAIKTAVSNTGPVYTTLNASFPGFSAYDGTTVLHHAGLEPPNHAVVIVGWDDTLVHAGGQGAWICKNSWGTNWGAQGYFAIAYGSARVGENSSYFDDFKAYDYREMAGTLYHYDEAGWHFSMGFYGSETAYGLVKFTAGHDDLLTAVDFWATDDASTYTVEIYDDFDGVTPSNRLFGPKDTACALAGYYSVPLDTPVWLAKGNDFYVVVKGRCSGYTYPMAVDGFAPTESNKTYLSRNLSGPWYEMGSYGYDVSIRARTRYHQPVFAGRDFSGDGLADIAVWRPSDGNWFVRGGTVQNWGIDGDIPTNGDYDGDGKADLAVWRASVGYWFIRKSGGATDLIPWGTGGDIPVPGDYDGDGKADAAVWRPSSGHWFLRLSGGGLPVIFWGQNGDIPLPGDYDGDGRADPAVWRPAAGTWFIKLFERGPWGLSVGEDRRFPGAGRFRRRREVQSGRLAVVGRLLAHQVRQGGNSRHFLGNSGRHPRPGPLLWIRGSKHRRLAAVRRKLVCPGAGEHALGDEGGHSARPLMEDFRSRLRPGR